MTTPIDRPATADALFLWVMHRFAEHFERHAVLKGGMALRLRDCPRTTNDIDYVFVPFDSKKDVLDDIRAVLEELPEAVLEVGVHSKMIRAHLQLDEAAIQIEVSVAAECPSEPMPTAGYAREQGRPSQIVRVMRADVALAQKLAAWNERRLLRDLFDAWFLHVRVGVMPDPHVLQGRLGRIESRIPTLRRRRRMSLEQLVSELRQELDTLDQERVDAELQPVLPEEEVTGLASRMRSGLGRLSDRLEEDDGAP